MIESIIQCKFTWKADRSCGGRRDLRWEEGAPPRELMEGDGGSRAGEAAGRGEMGGGGRSSEGGLRRLDLV